MSLICIPAFSASDAEEHAIFQIVQEKLTPHFSIPVTIDAHHFARKGNWALISGLVVGVDQEIDWYREASEFQCNPDIDVGLSVLMRKDADEWQFEIFNVCDVGALEWKLEDYVAQLPCGFLEQISNDLPAHYLDYCPEVDTSKAQDELTKAQAVVMEQLLAKLDTNFSEQIRFDASRIEVDENWAVVAGHVHGIDGDIDWDTEALNCSETFSGVWAAMQKGVDGWQFTALNICPQRQAVCSL
uniref:hypothetical protein n=1 Tax=Thaumasiovibrio occultus TaxID=1891184 RepID=UPI00131C7D34|nr:hypothetical protein [Thaumasiovibrio occultus]